MFISDGGIANGGFVPDYSVVNETSDYSKTKIKRDFDKGKCFLFVHFKRYQKKCQMRVRTY